MLLYNRQTTNIDMAQLKNVCITSFNMTIKWDEFKVEDIDKKNKIKYLIIQGEHCKDGKKHIQGFIQFHTKIRMDTIKRMLNDNTLHIEPMRGTPEQARRYCTNEYTDQDGNHKDIWLDQYEYGELDTTISGTRTDLITLKNKIKEGNKLNDILMDSNDNKEIHNILQYNKPLKRLEEEVQMKTMREKLLKKYDGIKWNKLQQKILDILIEDVDNRKVHWFYDEFGNSGKSYISKYLQLTRDTYYITGGKQNDILYGYEGQQLVIIDLARTYADNLEHIYTIIENLKNGQYLSTKYETKQKLFDIPYIMVMANFKPDKSKLSNDRWDIIDTLEYQDETDTYNIPEPIRPLRKKR